MSRKRVLKHLKGILSVQQMANNGLWIKKWYPSKIINGESHDETGQVCLVLNTKITIPPKNVQDIWQSAQIRILVDGGSNRWLDFISQNFKTITIKPPDFITGDFDSIKPETGNFFNEAITTRVHTPDQNATDFTKAIDVIQPLMKAKKLNDIIVFHETSGRFDQIMANINTLFSLEKYHFRIFLVSGNSLTWLLQPGTHVIQIPKYLVEEDRWCALIPIGEAARCVTTKGLKWNLENCCMKFGTLVSTSNKYADDQVEIATSDYLIWSMGIFNFDDGYC